MLMSSLTASRKVLRALSRLLGGGSKYFCCEKECRVR